MPTLAEALKVNLKRIREQRGFTQESLSDAIGKTRNTINRYEAGQGSAKFETIVKLAVVLGVDETDLLYPGKPPEPIKITPTPEEALETFLDDYRRLKAQESLQKASSLHPTDEEKLLAAFRELPPESRALVMTNVRGKLKDARAESESDASES